MEILGNPKNSRTWTAAPSGLAGPSARPSSVETGWSPASLAMQGGPGHPSASRAALPRGGRRVGRYASPRNFLGFPRISLELY